MKLVNLTSYSLKFVTFNDEEFIIDSSGVAAITDCEPIMSSMLDDDSGLTIPVLGYIGEEIITGLPEPTEGTIYIVTMMVALHPSVRGRKDVFWTTMGMGGGEIKHNDNYMYIVDSLISSQ